MVQNAWSIWLHDRFHYRSQEPYAGGLRIKIIRHELGHEIKLILLGSYGVLRPTPPIFINLLFDMIYIFSMFFFRVGVTFPLKGACQELVIHSLQLFLEVDGFLRVSPGRG